MKSCNSTTPSSVRNRADQHRGIGVVELLGAGDSGGGCQLPTATAVLIQDRIRTHWASRISAHRTSRWPRRCRPAQQVRRSPISPCWEIASGRSLIGQPPVGQRQRYFGAPMTLAHEARAGGASEHRRGRTLPEPIHLVGAGEQRLVAADDVEQQPPVAPKEPRRTPCHRRRSSGRPASTQAPDRDAWC